jgi:hypothetical protein
VLLIGGVFVNKDMGVFGVCKRRPLGRNSVISTTSSSSSSSSS